MKIAYFDCFSGISGDMCLGSLVDAGADLKAIERGLGKLPVKGYRLASRKVLRGGISSTKVDVMLRSTGHRKKHGATRWRDIEKTIGEATLSEGIRQKGLEIFRRLFEAEARVHGEPFREVHLHELGGVDCMVDIFGALIGLELLGVEKIYTSPVNLGSGTIETAHGILPVPAPATVELLKGYPVYSSGAPFELATPTGAAILSGLGAEPLRVPCMRLERTGFGAGDRETGAMPNVLRLLIGETTGSHSGFPDFTAAAVTDTVAIIETNIDDMNPQLYEHVMEKLFGAGALDVFLENIIMKKGRPAVKLTVIAGERQEESLADILFRETTTIGVRFSYARRKVLKREIRRVKTRLGEVRIKVAKLGDKTVNVSPEYDDLKALAAKKGLPLKEVAEAIMREIASCK